MIVVLQHSSLHKSAMPGRGTNSNRGRKTNQKKGPSEQKASVAQKSSSPTSASPKAKEKPPPIRGTASAGQTVNTKGKRPISSGASETLDTRKSQPSPVSKTGETRGDRTKRKKDQSGLTSDMSLPMEWESTPESKTMRSSASSAVKGGGAAENRSSGSGHHGGQTLGAASGEGHSDSAESQESDAGSDGNEDLAWEKPEQQTKKPSLCDVNQSWKGVPPDKLRTAPDCLPKDMKLERSSQHTFTIKLPFKYNEDVTPEPLTGASKWDTDHVRMPHSSESKCFIKGKEEKRWDVIVEALTAPIRGPFELEDAILKYNQRYINKWKFTVLHHYFINHVDSEERKEFFEVLLPQMKEFALTLRDVCPVAIPLLKKGKAKKLTLSQFQIACLLTHAFFCTFPLRSSRTKASEYSNYPDINFSHLFVGEPVPRKLQKLKCLIHYFKRVMFRAPSGIVTFSRQTLSSPHSWYSSMENLTKLHVSSTGTIEDNGRGMLQVDFANKFLGGGVLGNGCVQEEIRFIICPEMIITRLFTEGLDLMESVIMTGCERFSEYEGYSDSFKWKGNYTDDTPRDQLGRLCCEVVAIDAQVFRSDYNKQFKRSSIERELNKAYCGFKTSANEGNSSAVCTGNWGCGAFGGDKQLKALIQVMAASVAKRDVCYFTFDDEQLTRELFQVHDRLCQKEKTVADIFSMLEDYNRTVVGSRWSGNHSVFEFIHKQLDKLSTYTDKDRAKPSAASGYDSSEEPSSWFCGSKR